MAFRNISFTLSSGVSSQLVVAQAGDVDVWINAPGINFYFLGGPAVTISDGLHLVGSDTFHTKVRPGDELWGVAASAATGSAMVRSA